MKIHVTIPFDIEKNLGRSYNETMALIPEDDWACLIDHDILLGLIPDAINILYKYAELNPDAGLLTCFTNRCSPLSTMQLLNQRINNDSDIRKHISYAEKQKALLYQITVIDRDISGFLMLISKRTWDEFKFSEDGKCLSVDTSYGRKLREAGKQILRMDGLFIFHLYRMKDGIFYKKHLL